MGRPTKLTPNIQTMIIQCIRLGFTYSKTAELAGITRHTLLNWMKWGRSAKSGIYFNFFNALQEAKAEGEMRNIQQIQEAATEGQEVVESREFYEDKKLIRQITKIKKAAPDWRAAAWILERRYPERYGRQRKLGETYKSTPGNYEIYILAKVLNSMSKSDIERIKYLIKHNIYQ